MVDNIGIVTASIETIAVASLLLVGIFLNFRHRVYLPVIKGFEMSAAGLDIILEMQISRRIVVSGSDSGWKSCLLYTSPSPRDATLSRMPSSA